MKRMPFHRKGNKRQVRLAHALLHEHFAGLPPENIAASSRVFPRRVQADLQRALEATCLQGAIKTVGIHCIYQHESLRFSVLMEQSSHPKSIAPLQYEDVDIGEADPVRCLVNALILAEAGGMPAAPSRRTMSRPRLRRCCSVAVRSVRACWAVRAVRQEQRPEAPLTARRRPMP